MKGRCEGEGGERENERRGWDQEKEKGAAMKFKNSQSLF